MNAADVFTNDKEREEMTNQVDALKLARRHASHNLKAIYVPNEDDQKQRNRIRYHKRLLVI